MAKKKSQQITHRANKKREILSKNLSKGLGRSVKRLRGVYSRRRKKLNNAVSRQRKHSGK